MQNQNLRLAAQLVTKQLHQEKADPVTCQAGVKYGQTSQHQINEQTHPQAQPHQQLGQQTGQFHEQEGTMPPQPYGTQYTQGQDKPSYTPGQQQPNATGQGQHYPQGHQYAAHVPQSSIQGDMPPGPVPCGNPSADFGDVYRTGNFGEHFGKVNFPRAKRWLLAHGILSFFMFVFTLAATIMMRDYTNTVFKDMLLAFTWMAALLDWMLFASAAFFLFKLSTLRNPLTTLMVMRTFSALTFALNLFFFLVGLLGLLINNADFVRLTSKEVGFLKFIFVVITILMAAKIVTSYSFVFLWWKNRDCCHCFAGYCVFEEGDELAPGVANSAGTENIIAFGQAAAAFGEAMNRS